MPGSVLRGRPLRIAILTIVSLVLWGHVCVSRSAADAPSTPPAPSHDARSAAVPDAADVTLCAWAVAQASPTYRPVEWLAGIGLSSRPALRVPVTVAAPPAVGRVLRRESQAALFLLHAAFLI